MNLNLGEAVYLTLTGELIPEAALPGVENAFGENGCCFSLMEELGRAELRLLDRLGQRLEDPDLEIILANCQRIQELLCLEMFWLGRASILTDIWGEDGAIL